MTDLRTLIHASAPLPRRPLDMDAVLRRSRRVRLRRVGAWFATVGLTVGVGVPGGAVLVTAGGDSRAAAPVTTTSPPSLGAVATSTTVAPDAGKGGAATRATSAPTTAAVPATRGRPAPTSQPAVTPTTAPTPPEADYPLAASCSVDNDGLGSSERRSCSFTASEAGGLHGEESGDPAGTPEPDRRVTVTRQGSTRIYVVRDAAVFIGDEGVSCDNDAVRPGDRVLVEIVNPPTGTGNVVRSVGAGAGWSCY